MDTTSPGSDVISPESTVTTLLSSSGRLRSSLLVPDHNTTFRYQDKVYESASAALQAYIADFDKSQNSESWMRGLLITQSPLCTPRRPRMSTLRNRSVFRERLTDREVDILTLPVSSLRHRDNHDRLSMTTDELLSIPRDGSMPVTHTTAFIQGSGVLSQSVTSKDHASCRPRGRAGDDLSHLHLSRNSRSCRCKKGDQVSTLKQGVPFVRCLTCAHRAARDVDMSPWLHLPGTGTGNEADTDRAPVISVPETNYPARIQYCDLSEPTPPPEVDGQKSLRNLRLQFAEQISLLASERKHPDFAESFQGGNRLESLIQKADQVVNFLSQSSGATQSLAESARIEAVTPVDGEEMHDCSSSCCPAIPMGSAKLAEDIHQPHGGSHDGSSIRKQPGALEALKQMMFRLQAVEAALHKHQHPSAASAYTDWLQGEETPKRPDSEAEQSFSGGLSLHRALYHLSRLKLLLDEPKGKQDEDEGWCSSLSDDRVQCPQQEPH